MHVARPSIFAGMLALAAGVLLCLSAQAQTCLASIEKVMTLMWTKSPARTLPQDQGAVGLWQKLQKLQTTASVLHTVAHPDDEHAGMLTYLSRGAGARVALLSLSRGEAGANVLGGELFDELGLLRTEELLLAGAYYGLDDLYFTTAADYGYSKTLDEAIRNWGRENVLRDVVRVIRINRPLVLLARFHGSERDGHGHHQTAGILTQEAYRLAGDPNAFPEQITEEGLRPWQPLKLYRGDVRENEHWTTRIDVGQHIPWLGTTYQNFGARGWSMHRSQFGGVLRELTGPQWTYYERLAARIDAPAQERGVFEDIDTSLPALFGVLGEAAPSGAVSLLQDAEAYINDAIESYEVQNPSTVVPPLAGALKRIRQVLDGLGTESEVAFNLRIKEKQLMDAINTALGAYLTAIAAPEDIQRSDSPWAPPPTMGVVVPGQQFLVDALFINPSTLPVENVSLRLESAAGLMPSPGKNQGDPLQGTDVAAHTFTVSVPHDARPSDRYFYRDGLEESRYRLRCPEYVHLPLSPPALMAIGHYSVQGVRVEIRNVVRTREAAFPYGYEMRELKVAPLLGVNVEPALRIVRAGSLRSAIEIQVELVHNGRGATSGELRLEAPSDWQITPTSHPFSFTQSGQRVRYTFNVRTPSLSEKTYEVRAVATVNDDRFTEGYEVIRQRDNDLQYLYRPALARLRGIRAELPDGLAVGYVMGAGDEVPSAIEQLGADVTPLSAAELASAELTRFDAIVVGTRAYAVRPDLITYNQRLLDFARNGGHLIVLYQTQEFVPETMAPFPASLPPEAEEVSEEDAPVRILASDHPLLNTPNEITQADFAGWVEQRGSKFFADWDSAYTALVETHDAGQAPQRGGWLTARVGDGHYTYIAYAIHRQVPYAVPGAFGILANLISFGRQ